MNTVKSMKEHKVYYHPNRWKLVSSKISEGIKGHGLKSILVSTVENKQFIVIMLSNQ